MTVLRIAHRAGNDLALVAPALAGGADVIEADIHIRRRRVEVRHARRLGPLPYLWEPWSLQPDLGLMLSDLRAAVPPAVMLMLDLKGWQPWLGQQVRGAMAGADPYIVCSREWRSLRAFVGDPLALVVHSAGSRGELRRLAPYVDGVGTWGVSVRRDLLSQAAVTRLRERAEVVMSWPVDTGETYDEVVSLGVNGVISNELTRLPRRT